MQKSCIVTFRCTESELERLTALADELDRTALGLLERSSLVTSSSSTIQAS